MEIKDSGDRTEFETGAVRDRAGDKGRMDLMPCRALIELSKLYEAGCKKYGDRNWEKGIPLSRFFDSGIRHATKYLMGMRDEPHLVQACWNFMCALDTYLRIKDGILPESLNDLPPEIKLQEQDSESKILDSDSDSKSQIQNSVDALSEEIQHSQAIIPNNHSIDIAPLEPNLDEKRVNQIQLAFRLIEKGIV